MSELNPIPLILTAIGSVCATVALLGYYGYLHVAQPEDALLLSEFTMLKTVPGEDYKAALKPASQLAQCIDGVLVLFDLEQKGLSGVLVDPRKQVVRCTEGQ
ncbi:MAG TPA: hypothetical protein VJ047_00725 [Pseudomonas sp.]|nr:hypothetical protein [Pseudomonas sp.]